MMKSWAGMEALINDHHSQNLDLLLIQEPPTTAYASTIWHNPLRDKLHLRLLETRTVWPRKPWVQKRTPFPASAIAEKAFIRNKIKKEWEQEWKTSKNGGHLRRMDGPLPAYRICRLYGSLTRNRAYLLAFEGHKLSIRQDEAVPGIMLVTIKVHLS
ncbi:hypothetical protein CBS147321_11149 [Aspergillus niger]|nr:hypothetical protein CBS147321_11149 [Aspergillus niger]